WPAPRSVALRGKKPLLRRPLAGLALPPLVRGVAILRRRSVARRQDGIRTRHCLAVSVRQHCNGVDVWWARMVRRARPDRCVPADVIPWWNAGCSDDIATRMTSDLAV